MTLGQAIESGIYARDKEIARLKKELTEEKNAYIKMYNMYVEKDNIINELEKTLNNYDLDYMNLVGEHLLADILEDLKDKIEELKGSDKE